MIDFKDKQIIDFREFKKKWIFNLSQMILSP